MTDRESLIEKAKQAIHDYDVAHARRVSVSPDRLAVLLAEMVAVFEAAHTPTDDEREALADRLARRLIDDPKQLMLAEGTGALHVALSDSIRSVIEDVYADCGDSDPGVLSSNIARRLAWDLPPAILADAGFRRRSEVSEPSAECPQPCEHLSQHDAWEGRTCPEHPCTCPEPQGEPSDAQVRAAAESIARDDGQRIDVVPEWADAYMPIALAALRAAGGVR